MAVKQTQIAQTAQATQAGAVVTGRRSQARNRIVEFFDESYLVGNMKDGSGRITGYNGSPVSPIYKAIEVGTLQELKQKRQVQIEAGLEKMVFVKAESPVRRIYAICELVPAHLKRIVLNAVNNDNPWLISSKKQSGTDSPIK